MHEPHEAREDTVMFSPFRSLLSPEELTNLAGAFAEIQGSKFGINASGGIVNQVSWIEQAFDNYNLGEFTPAPVS